MKLTIVGIVLAVGLVASLVFLHSCGTAYDEYSPGAMLKKYEWFKNQAESYKQISARYENFEKAISNFVANFPDRAKWSWQDREEYQRLCSVRDGYLSQVNSIIADYNAQSGKFNWSAFNTADVPRRLEYQVK
jgi:hypothetical protein